MKQHQTEQHFWALFLFLGSLLVLMFDYEYHPLETVSPEVLGIRTWRTACGAAYACVLQGGHSTEVAASAVKIIFCNHLPTC